MKTIAVTASKSYNVIIAPGLLKTAGQQLRAVTKAQTAAIITDSNVGPLYAETLKKELEGAGFSACMFTFPAGEASKTAETYLQILQFLAKNHLTRSDVIVALGGGVTGDMAGFAAATYLRGIDFVQIPTSLLAMVDSSVGGKTAIDLPQGKNLAGAFYQPLLVLCDTDLLSTLPEENFLDGCGEIVKYGVLGNRELLKILQEAGTDFDLESVVAACVEMKRDIVNADEFESGSRQLLNLGHTLGHAVEKNSGYALSHGTCVAIGLAVVTRAAEKEGLCPGEDAREILNTIKKLNLPTRTDLSMDVLMDTMLSDKKRRADTITCVVPHSIGNCMLEKMTFPRLRAFMEAGM